MGTSARLAALAVVVVLLAQPLLANAACQSKAAEKDCPPVCPMGDEHRSGAQLQRANTLSCCQISPARRAPATPGAKDRESSSTTLLVPAAPVKVHSQAEGYAPALPFSIPHASHSPLHTLNCVFLI